MSRSIENTFIETVQSRALLPKGTIVTAAVSGGADSVLLLILLNKFKHHMNWNLSVLHIDHGIRENSHIDAEFVQLLAQELAIPFQLKSIKAGVSSLSEGFLSSQRQKVYIEVAEDNRLIAVGHTASDRAETLLMRLMEGAGLRGLGGMDYVGIGPVRRPLLDITREQVREYLEENAITWLEDPTNNDNSILRNSVRNIIFPCIESVKPGCITGFSRASSGLSAWRDYLDGIIEEQLKKLVEDSTFDRDKYLALSEVIRLSILWDISGRPRGGRFELEKTDRWIGSGENGFHDLPGGVRLVIQDRKISYRNRCRGEE